MWSVLINTTDSLVWNKKKKSQDNGQDWRATTRCEPVRNQHFRMSGNKKD